MATMSLAEMFKEELAREEKVKEVSREKKLKAFREDVARAIRDIHGQTTKVLAEIVRSDSFRNRDGSFTTRAGACVFDGQPWYWEVKVQRGSELVIQILFKTPDELISLYGGKIEESGKPAILREVMGKTISLLFPESEWRHEAQYMVGNDNLRNICVAGVALK